MRIVVTGGASPLATALCQAFQQTHTVQSADFADQADLKAKLADLPVLVHIPPLLWAESATDIAGELQQLEVGGKQFYALLEQAQQLAVKRVLYISSLQVMAGYDHSRYIVTASWQPRPNADGRVLGLHLGELILREFVRMHHQQMRGICLRIDDRRMLEHPEEAGEVAGHCVQAVQAPMSWEHFVVRHVPAVGP